MVDTKVEKAVDHAIDKFIQQIDDFRSDIKNDIHHLQDDLNRHFLAVDGKLSTFESRLTAVELRLTAVETKLGMVQETRNKRSNFIDYCFKVGMVVSNGMLLWLIAHAHFISTLVTS